MMSCCCGVNGGGTAFDNDSDDDADSDDDDVDDDDSVDDDAGCGSAFV